MVGTLKDLGEYFDKAAKHYCGDEGCYVATCPVNCLAALVGEHLRSQNYWLLFGDYMIAKRLAKDGNL